MLDLKYIREHPQDVRQGAAAKGRPADIDRLLEYDAQKRAILANVEQKKHQKNLLNEQINELRKRGNDFQPLISQSIDLNSQIETLTSELNQLESEIHEILISIPNLPLPSVPTGIDENDNLEIRKWGEIPAPDFEILPHWEIGTRLGIMDFQKGADLAGSFFVNYQGAGARLNRALVNFMLDLHTSGHGYTEISPPYLAQRNALFNTGQIPALESDMYRLERDDLFLIPTAEVPLTNLLKNEIPDESDLPVKYVAATPCFRREAGTHGRENRGLIRTHQFDKVELVQFVEPDKSGEALEELLAHAEQVLKKLELPYRVIELCTVELSFAAAKCYDLEVWAPGLKRYLEVSSCSTFTDFQARRANIRYRPEKSKKPRFVHTLNASGVALPRTVIAILEHYQTDEGTVVVPDVLRKYMGTAIIKSNK